MHWGNLLIALGALVLVVVVATLLKALFPSSAKEKEKIPGFRKGLDYIGVAVVFLCHDGEGNYITYKRGAGSRDEKHTWDIGAGGVRFGERIEDALRREIKEEYCTDIRAFEFMGYRDVHRKSEVGEPTHWITLDYKVHVVREQVGIGEPDVIDEIRWWRSVDEIPTPRMSQLSYYLDKYKDKL